MKCNDCNNANICLDHIEILSLGGCTSGIPDRKVITNADRIRNMSDDRYLFKAKTAQIVGIYNNGLEDGVWVHGSLRCDVGKYTIFQFETERADYVEYEIDPSTICQCTGLKDKNGKLIWENDILSGHIDDEFPEDETRKRVVWHENGWCTNEPGCDDYEELDDFDSENFEVIGNMIDNPELLEVRL